MTLDLNRLKELAEKAESVGLNHGEVGEYFHEAYPPKVLIEILRQMDVMREALGKIYEEPNMLFSPFTDPDIDVIQICQIKAWNIAREALAECDK